MPKPTRAPGVAEPWIAHYGEHAARELSPPSHANLPALLSEAAARYADQIAFTTCTANGMHGSLTYAQVEAKASAFAVYLRQGLGLAAGTRVALQTPNCLAYPVVAFGILKAACVLVNTNPLYTPTEMEHQFRDSGAEVVVIVDMFADKLTGMLARTSIKKVVVVEVPQFFSPVPRAVIRGVMRWWNKVLPPLQIEHVRLPQALAKGAALQQQHQIDVASYTRDLGHADLALLQYTGGTTGVAKGAMLSHGNLLHNLDQAFGLGRSHIDDGKEVVLTALPLHHIFAFTFNLLCFYPVGARNVLVPSPRPIQNLQRAFDNYPITWISGVNTLFNALMNEEWFTAFPPRHLKAAVAGGAALQHAVAERWQRFTGTRIAEGYGLTESSPVVSFNPITGTPRPDSIGLPLSVYGATVGIGLIGMLLGYGLSKLLRQDPRRSRTIAIETGIQNGPLAVLIVVLTFKDELQQQVLLIPVLYSLFIVLTSSAVTVWFRRITSREELAREQAKVQTRATPAAATA